MAMTNEVKILTMLETLVDDVGTLKDDVGTLKDDVGGLKADVGTLKADVGTLKADVGGLKNDVGTLKDDARSLNQRMDSLEQEVKKTKEIVIKMEHDHGYKINALFDGYQANRDLNIEISQRMSVCEKRCDKLELDVIVLKSEPSRAAGQ